MTWNLRCFYFSVHTFVSLSSAVLPGSKVDFTPDASGAFLLVHPWFCSEVGGCCHRAPLTLQPSQLLCFLMVVSHGTGGKQCPTCEFVVLGWRTNCADSSLSRLFFLEHVSFGNVTVPPGRRRQGWTLSSHKASPCRTMDVFLTRVDRLDTEKEWPVGASCGLCEQRLGSELWLASFNPSSQPSSCSSSLTWSFPHQAPTIPATSTLCLPHFEFSPVFKGGKGSLCPS